MKVSANIFCIVLLLFSMKVSAVEKVEIQALMPGMVVLLIDGERATLKKDAPVLQGVTLISSTTREAVLEIDGVQKTYQMGTAVSTNFTERESITEQIMIDRMGMFRAHGSINGQSIRFLVDTGATSVAMSSTEARKLGIQYRLDGRQTKTHTASGIAKAWAITLKSVRVGQLLEKNVPGIVVDGEYPRHVLLGMSFLNRMKVEKEGSKMIISRKK